MSEVNEIQTAAALAVMSVEAKVIEPGTIYTIADGEGQIKVIDTDDYAESPRRTQAHRKVSDSRSFNGYLSKHALPQTEVYANVKASSVVAIVDSHEGTGAPAGWQAHRLTLQLETTKSWEAWMAGNNKLFRQADFAEFIEQRATDVEEPSAGDLMAMAQTFYMTKDLEFQSTDRASDGQTELVYKEKITTKGLGKTEVPKELKLALQPYVGGPRQYCVANLRTRLDGSTLLIGYVLVRPEEILEGIFTDIVTEIREGKPEGPTGPAFTGITAPIYYGHTA